MFLCTMVKAQRLFAELLCKFYRGHRSLSKVAYLGVLFCNVVICDVAHQKKLNDGRIRFNATSWYLLARFDSATLPFTAALHGFVNILPEQLH